MNKSLTSTTSIINNFISTYYKAVYEHISKEWNLIFQLIIHCIHIKGILFQNLKIVVYIYGSTIYFTTCMYGLLL